MDSLLFFISYNDRSVPTDDLSGMSSYNLRRWPLVGTDQPKKRISLSIRNQDYQARSVFS